MLDIQFIQNNVDLVKQNMINRNKDIHLIDKLLMLHEKRVKLIHKIDKLNTLKKLKANKENTVEGKKIKEDIKAIQKILAPVEKEYFDIWDIIPNIPTDDTPIGKDETQNIVIYKKGNKREFDFTPLPHWEIGENLNILNNKLGANTAGARFTYFIGEAALLELAIIRYVFKILTDKEKIHEIIKDNKLNLVDKPFIPVIPPIFIKPDVLQKTGRLHPKEDRFYLPNDDLYLAGSAEQTLMPMFMNQVIKEEELPIRHIGISTACRREAGTYGKDMKGILRMHQFDKAEMISIATAENGLEEQNLLTAIQEYLLHTLGLPYQKVAICTGDMGGPDARQIDMETWMPGIGMYKETQTADYNTDYQARRLNIKVKRKSGNTQFAHTNDATAFAIGRIIAAIIENYQQKDGTFLIPDVLKGYM